MYILQKFVHHIVLIVFLSITPVVSALAGERDVDAGLYDPVPPANSAFVRFFVLDPEKEVTPSIRSKTYPALGHRIPSPYYVAKNGENKISAGAGNLTATLESGKFYTVLVNNNTLTLLTDPAATDRTKAMVIFYNLTQTDDVSLKTGDGKIEVVAPLKKETNGNRAINPLKIGFAVHTKDGKSLATLESKGMERGMVYSIFAVPINDKTETSLLWAQSKTNTKL